MGYYDDYSEEAVEDYGFGEVHVTVGCEYAKSGRAKCKGCYQTIAKGEARWIREEEGDEYGYGNKGYYHIKCYEPEVPLDNVYGPSAIKSSYTGGSKTKKAPAKKATPIVKTKQTFANTTSAPFDPFSLTAQLTASLGSTSTSSHQSTVNSWSPTPSIMSPYESRKLRDSNDLKAFKNTLRSAQNVL